jgi:hypothetical protein
MSVRRIAVSACALCLVLPVAANARPVHPPHKAGVQQSAPFADTRYDLHKFQQLSGDTKGDIAQATPQPSTTPKPSTTDVDRVGSLSAAQLAAAYGTDRPTVTPLASLSAAQLAAAYGTDRPTVTPLASLSAAQTAAAYGTDRPKVTRAAPPASSNAPDDNTGTWRGIAVGEAALLAAFALASAALRSGRLSPRRRAAGLGV